MDGVSSQPPSQSPEPPPAAPRKRRIWLRALLAVLALVVLAIVFLPMLISMGMGQGLIQRLAAEQLEQPLSFESVDLNWFGEQQVRGLHFGAEDGPVELQGDVRLSAGLWLLLTDALGADLGTSAQPSDGEASALQLPALDLALEVEQLDVTLRQSGLEQPIVFEALRGAFEYHPGGALTLDATTRLDSAEAVGEVALTGELRGAFDDSGRFTPHGAAGQVVLSAPRMRLPELHDSAEIRDLNFEVRSTDLADHLNIDLRGDSHIEGQSSPLTGAFVVASPFGPDGRPRLDLAAVSGTLQARQVPSAPLQPFLASTPIILARDVGPYLDIEARLGGGASGHDVNLDVSGRSARLMLSATVDPDARDVAGRLELKGTLDPALVAALTPVPVLGSPADYRVEVEQFQLPATVSAESLGEASARGRLQLPAELQLQFEGTPEPLRVADLDLTFEFDGPEQRLALRGGTVLEGAPAEIDVTVPELFDDDGRMRPADWWPEGQITWRGAAARTLAARVPQAHREVARELLAGGLDFETKFLRPDGRQQLHARLRTTALDAQLAAQRSGGHVVLSLAELRCNATPDLVRRGQGGDEPLVALAAPAAVRLTASPLHLPEEQLNVEALKSLPVELHYTVEAADLRLAQGPCDALNVRQLAGVLNVESAAPLKLSTRGNVRLTVPDSGDMLAPVEYTLNVTAAADGPLEIDGRAGAPQISLAALEQLMEAGAAARRWAGDEARVDATFQSGAAGWAGQAAASSARIRGTWRLQVDQDLAVLQADDAAVALDPELLEGFGLEVPRAAGPATDYVVQPEVRALRCPTALLLGKPFDPQAVQLELAVDFPPIGVRGRGRGEAGGAVLLDDLALTLKSQDLQEGIQVQGRARVRDTEKAAADLDFAIHNLVSAERTLDPAAASLSGMARLTDVPTALLDGLLGLDGQLEAALGPRSKATLWTENLSRASGRMSAKFRSVNGSFSVPKMRGEEGRLVLDEDKPAVARLRVTPEFRQRLLRKIHPLFADIETSKEPLEATIHKVAIPLDGDLRRLDAELNIKVGDVQFHPGALVTTLMASSQSGEPLPGRIEPVNIRIRGGLLNYDRFNVYIEDYFLTYSGTIDLETNRLRLRHEVPISVLSRHVEELQGYVDNVSVPLLTTGTIDDPHTSIDPSFDMTGAVLQNTVDRVLEDLLGVGGGRAEPPPKEDRKPDAGDEPGEDKKKKRRRKRPR